MGNPRIWVLKGRELWLREQKTYIPEEWVGGKGRLGSDP